MGSLSSCAMPCSKAASASPGMFRRRRSKGSAAAVTAGLTARLRRRRKALCLRMVFRPPLQGTKVVDRARHEDRTEPLKVRPKVSERLKHILREPGILRLAGDTTNRSNRSDESFVCDTLLADMVCDEAKRVADVEFGTTILPPIPTAGERSTATRSRSGY